jgi:hypothetical protein
MKRSRKSLLILILTLTILVGLGITYRIVKLNSGLLAKPSKKSEVEFVLVKSAFGFNQINLLKPNAILLITDKDEIEIDQELFLAEKNINHLCGNDYEIQFWMSYDSLYNSIFINQECEQFSYKPQITWKQFDSYKRMLAAKPTHYLYNLKIPVDIQTEELKSKMMNNELLILYDSDPIKRYPSIYFSHRINKFVGKDASDSEWAKAEKENERDSRLKINSIIAKIRNKVKVIAQSEIFYNAYGRAWEEMTHNGSVTISIKNANDINLVTSILKQEGAKVDNIINSEYCFVQLIDTSSNIQNVKMRLLKYKFIKEVTEYTE